MADAALTLLAASMLWLVGACGPATESTPTPLSSPVPSTVVVTDELNPVVSGARKSLVAKYGPPGEDMPLLSIREVSWVRQGVGCETIFTFPSDAAKDQGENVLPRLILGYKLTFSGSANLITVYTNDSGGMRVTCESTDPAVPN